MWEKRRHGKGEMSLLAQYCFTARVQKISNSDEIQSIILTPEKLLIILIYESLCFDEI